MPVLNTGKTYDIRVFAERNINIITTKAVAIDGNGRRALEEEGASVDPGASVGDGVGSDMGASVGMGVSIPVGASVCRGIGDAVGDEVGVRVS